MAVIYPGRCQWTLVLQAQRGLQDLNCQLCEFLHAVTWSGGKPLSFSTQ